MQIFSDFFENMKNKNEKWVKTMEFFIFWKVLEQSDQVVRKPDFLLRTCNNDSKQKDES